MKLLALLDHFKRGDLEEKGDLEKLVEKMVERVDVAAIKGEIKERFETASQWRSLQNAFSKDLRGTLKKIPLFKLFFKEFLLPSISELEVFAKKFRDHALMLMRDSMVQEITETLRNAGDSHHTRHGSHDQTNDVSQHVKEQIEQAVHGCITMVDILNLQPFSHPALI